LEEKLTSKQTKKLKQINIKNIKLTFTSHGAPPSGRGYIDQKFPNPNGLDDIPIIVYGVSEGEHS
jgi:hypothetical protein